MNPTPLVRALAVVLAAVSLSTDLAAQRDQGDRRGGDRRRAEPPELRHLVHRERSFEAPALGGRAAEYGVFLPRDYDAEENAEREYPLVLWLHGMFEDHERFLTRGGAEVLDRMTGEGAVPPMVFVCASDGTRRSFWTNAVGEDAAYENLVTDDLLADVEAHFRVRKDREGRALMGVSMGGYGALKIALKHPDRFAVVATHSAAVLPPDPERLMQDFPWLRQRGQSLLASIFGDPVDVDRFRAENVLVLVEQADAEALGRLRIYFDAGTDDRYGFDETNQLLHEALAAKEIEHVWRLVEGGGHSWGEGATQAGLPHSLGFVAARFAQQRATESLGGLLGPSRGKGE